jgi:SAM-dependent methyltransferase
MIRTHEGPEWRRPVPRVSPRGDQILFPFFPLAYRTTLDRLALRLGALWIRCLVCGTTAPVRVKGSNLREACPCRRCGAINRQRQLAYVVISALSDRGRFPSLAELGRRGRIAVYNTESGRAIHEALRELPGYRCSEFLSPDLASGTVVDGVEHQDLQALSFSDETFDLVLSGDVLEHVPDPYRAHAEIYRVLRPGGRHVFTVPYLATASLDSVRARIRDDGQVEHFSEPEYHGDPVRPEDGALVFTIFGLEMIVRLSNIGFRVTVHRLHSLRYGILGPNQLVFEAQRPVL